jgi:FtsZ-binding cell division protein ZapB
VFKQLYDIVRKAFFLQHDLTELKDNVADLERELHDTREAVRQLAFELERVAERERHERERFALRIENALLRIERLPPPSKKHK